MIDRNPERDRMTERYLALVKRDHEIISVLARKVALAPAQEGQGTSTCPYCYLDTPHSPHSHDAIADAIDEALRDGIVLHPPMLKTTLLQISRQCREHGQQFLEGARKA